MQTAQMKRLCFMLLLTTGLAVPSVARSADSPFVGRWDVTVTTPNSTYPGWFELVEKDGSPAVRYQPRGGSVYPLRAVKLDGSHLILTLSRASANRPETSWDLTANGDRLTGTLKRGDTVIGQVSGARAPELKRRAPRAWTAPEPLFNGKDLTGWEPDNPANNHWKVQDGVLVNETRGANLRTTRKFDDFKLHIELNCPENSNSGIYLRGRYEVQLEYEPAGSEDGFHSMGSIYGFLAPAVQTPRKPGQWESFDITLVGRHVTIVRDGVTIIDKQEIPGITGGALDSDEAQPGPFYIQGDHTGGLQFRNITIAVPKR
jgi:3-keto-disaccharide hydrolase